ncbi:ATP phosphoribosyltransferase regulatory subunit [hydrothermal vent metagenome]|uniref:ATP phosphoribosyltransferase regulatory subunit n=1 Tax=hydrothermal vent metagenome TaxID=652676 RepID=A0A1W1DVX6_9ZZZZ
MLESLKLLSIDPIVLSLGNVAIFNALIAQESLSGEQVAKLRQIFARRSTPDLTEFIGTTTLNNADKFSTLMKLEGDASILDKALGVFSNLPEAKSAIEDLIKISTQLSTADVEVMIDLAELKAYEYHTGVVFSAYNEDYSKALAQGGRYNGLSASFGKARAATGFSFDLKFLSQAQ